MKLSTFSIVLITAILGSATSALAQSSARAFFWAPTLAQLFDRPDFFERGNELFEEEIQQFQQQNPEPSLAVEDREKQQWQHLILRGGGFSVWIPQEPLTEETKVLETTTGAIEFKVLAAHPQDSRFIVAYSDELAPAQLENSETLLAQVRDQLVENTAFELISDRAISFNEYSGKQLRLQNSGETITFRVYLIGQRLYVLGASQPEAGEPSQTAIAFFNSFQLLE